MRTRQEPVTATIRNTSVTLGQMRKIEDGESSMFSKWCPRRDSNSHDRSRGILKSLFFFIFQRLRYGKFRDGDQISPLRYECGEGDFKFEPHPNGSVTYAKSGPQTYREHCEIVGTRLLAQQWGGAA